MSSMFQVVICAERSRGMRSISFTCHLEAFQREDSWGSFRFSVRRASNLRKPVGDLRFRTHQFPMETLKSREFNYSWNFISISRSMSCHDINVLFFSFFFLFLLPRDKLSWRKLRINLWFLFIKFWFSRFLI